MTCSGFHSKSASLVLSTLVLLQFPVEVIYKGKAKKIIALLHLFTRF